MSSSRPDRGIVVKCAFDKARKKISFNSSRNCTFEELRRKVDRCFALSAASYTISWKDDDGEIVYISTEDDLTEAICYFCSGDDAQSSSGSSILGFGRGKDVVLNVTIVVDYDGPSLSDTSSLASLDEYRARNGSQRSFSFGSPSIDLEDDSITVSSKDHLGPGSSTSSDRRQLRPSTSREDPFVDVSPTIHYARHDSDRSLSLIDDRQESTDYSLISVPRNPESSVTGSSISNNELTAAQERYPADPGAVFERLKIREALGEERSDWDGSTSEDLGSRWLREQNERVDRRRLGVVPESPSISEDEEDFDCLSLERNHKGQYYYTYNATEESQSYQIEEEPFRPLSDDGEGAPGPLARVVKPRPTSMQINWVRAQQHETKEQFRLQASASELSLRSNGSGGQKQKQQPFFQPIQEDTSFDLKYYNLPVPPAEIVTDCSNCGILLESFRYVCSTCGENPPVQLKYNNGKGKTKESPTDTTPGSFTYPPRDWGAASAAGSPGSSPSQTVLGSAESLFATHTRKFYQIVESKTSLLSSRTRVDPEPVAQPDEGPSGYELCPSCLATAGMVHSIDAAAGTGLGSPSSPNGPGPGGMPSPQPQQQDPRWRTTAPKKGLTRHSYLEKLWGEFGWENICQDENVVSVCSTCSATTETQRYKCSVCDVCLCRGCFSVVHHVHPIHPFILVPDKPKVYQGSIKEVTEDPFDTDEEEPSMEHRVTCSHCLMPIVGALFHCAICDSVDICSNCEAAGLPGNLESVEGGHNSSHILLKIPYVMEQSTVQKASRAAMRRWKGRDSVIAISASRAASQTDASHTQTIVGGGPASEDHEIPCSHCKEPIIGTRYQCAHCPSYPYPTAYNLCSRCEPGSWAAHDPMHIFFKLPRPVRRPLESPTSFLPLLYRAPAGPAPGNMRYQDPREYLKDVYHSLVLCDRCMKHIEGEWFRCAYCAKDLCDQCESVDTHAQDHLFVVFKSQIGLDTFQAWTNPDQPKPIIEYPVY